MSENQTTGSTFGSWLEEEGIREEIEAAATRRVEEWQMAQQTTIVARLRAWAADSVGCNPANAPCAEAADEIERLQHLLRRYRDETPLGHQPHMIAHEADKALGRLP